MSPTEPSEGRASDRGGTDTPYTPEVLAELAEIAARYPEARSGLLPMLHLVQSVEGFVSPQGIEVCAELLGITAAEVSGVATWSGSAPTPCAR
jgi:NADH-quinone oxidoreductase subunit E